MTKTNRSKQVFLFDADVLETYDAFVYFCSDMVIHR